MEKANKILNELLYANNIAIDSFYNVTITRWEISFQARFSSDLMAKLRESFGVDFKLSDDMVKAEFKRAELLIKIVLT